MDYFAIYNPSEIESSDENVFTSKEDALKKLKLFKDARFKSFKNKNEAIKFARTGFLNISVAENATNLKSPSSQPSLEKSNFKAPKSQELVKFRKEIEANNLQEVYKTIWANPRYLVSSGDTPSILKEGPRYNALHIAAISKHAKMAKLILQTVEQIQFIELLHGCKNDSTAEEVSMILLESYLNTPDKSRNETPLHFAAKFGAVDVIEVLIAYPMCKMKANVEGMYPKDIICSRVSNATPELKESIENLLKERFFVPVLRSSDNTVPPVIGDPFTPNNMPPKSPKDPLSPSMEIKAYAGPMDKDQAQMFRRRWKTPPRLIPSPQTNHSSGNLNMSFSPKSTHYSSPTQSPRHSKSMTEFISTFTSSTPKLAKKKLLFANQDNELNGIPDSDVNLMDFNDKNGNIVEKNGDIDNTDEFKEFYQEYRNPSPIIDSPMVVRRFKNDSNSNHIDSSLIANVGSAGLLFLDESGSVYSSENIVDSPSFREKHIRLTDTEKGLEVIGRGLAHEQNVGWKEFWDFLGTFVDIRSDDGLSRFENYLKSKEKMQELNRQNLSPIKSPKKNPNDSLSALCSGLYSLDLNEEIAEATKVEKVPASPTSTMSSITLFNEFMINNKDIGGNLAGGSVNSSQLLEKSCLLYAVRLVKLLAKTQIQDQHAYEKTLLEEIKKLNIFLESCMRDPLFSEINFKKIHSLFCCLFTEYLMQNNVQVEYLRNTTQLQSKVYALASQYSKDFPTDISKCHAHCLSYFITHFIEKRTKGESNGIGDSSAWNNPEVSECKCSFDATIKCKIVQRKNMRREFRKKLWDQDAKPKVDLWEHRNPQMFDEDESDDEKIEDYFSCESSDSENDEFFTPPSTPSMMRSEEDLSIFEESLEDLAEGSFNTFIDGIEPSKADFDVLNALGNDLMINETQFPLVSKWYSTMKCIVAKSNELSFKNRFRIFTPKLKMNGM